MALSPLLPPISDLLSPSSPLRLPLSFSPFPPFSIFPPCNHFRSKFRCSVAAGPTVPPFISSLNTYTLNRVIVGAGSIAQALATKHSTVAPNILVTEARDRVGGNISPVGWSGRLHAGRKPVKRPVPALRVAALSSVILEPLHQDSLYVMADAGAGYSLASYYTSLGLFVISVPGLWSLIKRSVKSKVVQKTFIPEGEGKLPNQVAGEILSFFTRNNFVVVDRGEAITFEGMMVPSRGQAALLTFCTCISLASVALVLTITVPDLGNNWFWLTSLSPLAGVYYWKKASRKEQVKVKMTVGDEGRVSEITVRGDDQQVEQVRKELGLSEKGMVYVKGLFERE